MHVLYTTKCKDMKLYRCDYTKCTIKLRYVGTSLRREGDRLEYVKLIDIVSNEPNINLIN